MKFNIDISGVEQQRYNSIKTKGEYLEINILVGTDKEQCDGHDRKNTSSNNCNAQDRTN